MSKIFRQHSSVVCFWCQTIIEPPPRNTRSYRCPHCDCWNRYDARGEIISDEPAMHDENLNTRSFARRGSPRKDRLPSIYGSALFCHTCQTNQMLLTNLLSNYLPPSDDPQYEKRSATYDEYKTSVEARYPPVCANCAPAVEEEIRKRDNMARTRALGGFLRAAKRNSLQMSTSPRDKERLERDIRLWKVRGCLWHGSLACALAGYGAVLSGQRQVEFPSSFRVALPVIVVCSLFWTFWDSTYSSMRRAQFQGRILRQRGKTEFIILQMLVWISRLSTATFLALSSHNSPWDYLHLWDQHDSLLVTIYCSACLAIELAAVVRSHFALQVQRPPAVRLTEDGKRRSSFTPGPASTPASRATSPSVPESDLLSSLSLSNKPIMHGVAQPSNPVFGMPSFPQGLPSDVQGFASDSMDVADDEPFPSRDDPNAMDWSPIRPPRLSTHGPPKRSALSDDGSWLRPQRFFAPEEPTGLEGLFAKTIRLADDSDANGSSRQNGHAPKPSARHWSAAAWWAMVGVVPLVAIVGAAFWYVN